MSISGWIFMIFSWAAIIFMTVYTFAKVLKSSNKDSKQQNNEDTGNIIEKK
ncbi:MAG: hypothetical protein ABFD00_00460 [Chloroherpetonaceae bacterium]|jgi:hypothetical protein